MKRVWLISLAQHKLLFCKGLCSLSLRAKRSNLNRSKYKDCHGHMLWPPKKIDGFYCGRIEIATVAALLRNDIGGLFSFLCILRIRSGARNDDRGNSRL